MAEDKQDVMDRGTSNKGFSQDEESEENLNMEKPGLQRQTSLRIHGSVMSFHDLVYTVKVKAPGKCCASSDKTIIRHISGIFKPGMNAIMGATGSGKTSLLDILACRKDPIGLKGDILVDGRKQPHNFKCMSGYVSQDDIIMGTLTVRENFHFSANLRLPKEYSYKEKEQMVDDTLYELGLVHCADSKVGTAFIRGVSGGERKRCNIGMELIISPAVLFLDEPTTGLDASTAGAVMMLLHRLSRRGRTIIFSIHQPRYAIYKLFDKLMLLSKGMVMYHGPAAEGLDYFSSIGYECEAHDNPADFFLDVVNGDSTAVQNAEVSAMFENETDVTKGTGNGSIVVANGIVTKVSVTDGSNSDLVPGDVEGGARNTVHPDEFKLAEELSDKFEKSTWNNRLVEEMHPIFKQYQNNIDTGKAVEVKGSDVSYSVSFGTQLRHLSSRTVLNLWRNPQASFMQVVIMIFFAVIVGAIYFRIDTSLKSGIQNRVGAFFFIVMNMIFGNLSSLELFLEERALFVHENTNGFYRVSVYFTSKIIFDMIPMRIIPVVCFSAVVYFMVGFEEDFAKWCIFTLNLVLTSLTAASVGFLYSAMFSVFAIANLLTALTFVFMMVFSGLLVNVNDIAEWLRWIKWISVFRYSLNTLSINELKDMSFCDTINYGNGTSFDMCDHEAGNQYLEDQGIPYETAWDLWQNMVALFGILLVFLLLTYIQLRRIKKYR